MIGSGWFLLGAPWDCSGSTRGEELAPAALRAAGLSRLIDVDLGDAATTIDRDLLQGPVDVPEAFWSADELADALASRHMGRVIAAFRAHSSQGRPIRQEIVAGWMGITQAQLSRIENGPPITSSSTVSSWWACQWGTHRYRGNTGRTSPRPVPERVEKGDLLRRPLNGAST